MNKSKVVLVQPPIEDFYLTKKRTIPYGLACIATKLLNTGFEVDIFDALATKKSKQIEYPDEFSFLKPYYEKDTTLFALFHSFKHFGYSFEHIGTFIRSNEPFIVGISSLFTAYAAQAIQTADTIKKFYPECKIIMGGHHPTAFPEKVLKNDSIDYVLRGDGETNFSDLCLALKNNTDIKHISGVAYKSQKRFYISDPSWIKSFNGNFQPSTHLIDYRFYQRKNKRSIVVVSSRGCPMHCSYCSVSASSYYAPFRQRETKDVFAEIKAQVDKFDIGFIDFEDENLCLKKDWFLTLFTQIRDLLKGKEIELRAMNGLYPPSIDEQIVCLMKDCGFKSLNLSLGSTSKDQLNQFKRPDVRASFEKALNLAQKYELECVSYIIAASPNQDSLTSLEDLLYLAQKRTLIGLSIYYPAPGSLDYDKCIKQNILPNNFSLMRSSALPLSHTTNRLQSVTLLRLSRILNFMKQVIDTEGFLPTPQPYDNQQIYNPGDRFFTSKKILQHFLCDGKIRGIRDDGTLFIHKVDIEMADKFCKRINAIEIVGVTSC